MQRMKIRTLPQQRMKIRTLPQVIMAIGDERAAEIFGRSVHTVRAWRLGLRFPATSSLEAVIAAAEREGYKILLTGIVDAEPVRKKRGFPPGGGK